MNRSEFKIAETQDREQYIVRPTESVPMTLLVPGSESHLISTKELTVSFLTMKANSVFDVHTHENAQCMIVTEGYCDEIIDGKIYRVEAGDVIYLPANIPHGAFILDVDCKAIDIFCPVREDYMEKFRTQNPDCNEKFPIAP
ncbi:cupin domain-containing protein [Agathobaculum sp. NSJ-28]|uniref:Cupin domain-containing protein n=1 Tax=Agathobaculum faecis TaxID=2763013 RepID=A0A923RWP7_9FIRM|nr:MULTISPECIES: cupin domain-containing protein [Agathobaculum]MBC5726223.1 cupin domain-containing protein [Agathobaculum faecis]